MVSDIQYTITLTSLVGRNTTISNAQTDDNPNNLGRYIDLASLKLSHSILDVQTESTIELTLNNNAEYNPESIPDLKRTLANMCGFGVVVTATTSENPYPRVIFDGYVSKIPSTLSVKGGSKFILICKTKLAQLGTITSNGSWDDSTQKYNTYFTLISGNTINFKLLLSEIIKGTLLEGMSINSGDKGIYIINEKAEPLPSEVWAVIIPTKTRLDVLREILIAYNRIIYQRQDGSVIIKPLFKDNIGEFGSGSGTTIYDVDVTTNNGMNNYNVLNITCVKNAPNIPNRVDVMFGASPPTPLFNSPEALNLTNEVYAVAPNVIASSNIINSVDFYATVYPTSVALYNSRKFVMPKMATISLGNDIFTDAFLMNSLKGNFKYSNIFYSSKEMQTHSMTAQLYAQLFLAEINTTNYNATIVYDYTQLCGILGFDLNLTGIINIEGMYELDYNQMMIASSEVVFNNNEGSIEICTTVPLLSITACWY